MYLVNCWCPTANAGGFSVRRGRRSLPAPRRLRPSPLRHEPRCSVRRYRLVRHAPAGDADVCPHAEGLRDHGAATAALLAREPRGYADHSVPGAFSLGCEDVPERDPRGVHDGAGQVAVAHHSLRVQLFDGDQRVLRGIRPGDLEVEISPPPPDRQMRSCQGFRGLPPTMAALHLTRQDVLASRQRGEGLTEAARSFQRAPIAVCQPGLQPHVDTDRWMLTRVTAHDDPCLANDQRVPVAACARHEVAGPRRAFQGPVHPDLDGPADPDGDTREAAVQPGVLTVGELAHVDGVPAVCALEAREAAPFALLLGAEEPTQGPVQAVSAARNDGGGDVLGGLPFEPRAQVVLEQELALGVVSRSGHFQPRFIPTPEGGGTRVGLR